MGQGGKGRGEGYADGGPFGLTFLELGSAGAYEPRFDYVVEGGGWASVDVELGGVGFDGEKTGASAFSRRCYDKPHTTLLF